jgi:membrane-anchored glycerophosphoryl diester phosphodiesterase (GDPDase)
MVDYVSERGVWQIITDSLRIYRGNFVIAYLVYLIPIFPILVLKLISSAISMEVWAQVLGILQAFVGIFTYGALTVTVSDVCVGNPPSIKRSYDAIGRVFWKYLGTYALYTAAFVVGLILLVLPGLYASVVLLFSLPVCVIEARSPIEACKRSIELSKGNKLRNFGVVFLATIVMFLAMIIVSSIVGIFIVGGLILLGLPIDSFQGKGLNAGILFILGLLSSAAVPILVIAATLLYYDVRARKENFDGAALAQELMT